MNAKLPVCTSECVLPKSIYTIACKWPTKKELLKVYRNNYLNFHSKPNPRKH